MLHRHPLLGALTLAYLVGVAWITLRPAPYGSEVAGVVRRLLEIAQRHELTDWLTFNRLEFLANVALFVPVGVFLVLLLGRRLWWLAIVAGALFSGGIELAQLLWLPTRVADPRDLVANGAGAAVGVILGLALTWPAALRRRRAVRAARG